MKNLSWKSLLGIVLGFAVSTILVNMLFSCRNNKTIEGDQLTKTLKEVVESTAANLPQQSPAGPITEARFSDNTAYMTIEVDEFFRPIMQTSAVLDSRLAALNVVSPIVLAATNDEKKDLAEAFKDSGVGFCYTYVNNDNGERKIVNIDNASLVEAVENLLDPASPSFFSDDFYKSYFSSGKHLLPLQLDEVTTWKDVKGVPSGVEYVYIVDGVSSQNITDDVKESIRQALIQELSADELTKPIRRQMTKTNLKFSYRYLDNDGRELAAIEILPSEIVG